MNRRILTLSLALLLCPLPLAAQESTPPLIKKSDEPIHITAKKMEVQTDKNVITFTGDVVAVQGDVTLTADELQVLPEKDKESGDKKGPGGTDNQKIRELIAKGNVQFHQVIPEEKRERFATSKEAHYWDQEGKVVLTGDPKVWEKDNVITGEVITFFTEKNLFLVDGKVKAVFFPDKKEGGTAPKGKEVKKVPAAQAVTAPSTPATAPSTPATAPSTPATAPSTPVTAPGAAPEAPKK